MSLPRCIRSHGAGLLGLWAPLLLALGCASAADLDPAAPVEVEIPPGWTAAEETARPELVADRWWQAMADPVLDELVLEALEHNVDLQAASARLAAAQARAKIAGAGLLPQAGLDLSGTRAKRNFIGFPIPGAEGEVLSVSSTTLSLALSVSWEADLWGRLRAGKRAAALDASAADEDLVAARLSLSGQVVKTYLTLLEARQQVELAERTAESRRRTGQRVRERYERGLSPSLELRLALSQIANVEASLAQRSRSLDFAKRQLEILLGRYPAGDVGAVVELPAAPREIPAGLPSELLLRRPDLRAAYDRALASSERLAESRAALYPRLSLTGSGGTSSIALEDLLDGDFSIWSLAGSLLQPLFQGGRLRAGVELAAAGEEESLARYVQQTLAAFAEVEGALATERYLDAQVEALEQAAAQSGAAERLAQERYAAGLADYLSVLESQRQAFLAEAALLEARRARLHAWVDLVLALGGDFLEPQAAPEPDPAGTRADALLSDPLPTAFPSAANDSE